MRPSSAPAREHSPSSLRRNRDWLILWTGDAVSEFGLVMGAFALTLVAMAITGSPAQSALVGSFFAGAMLLASLPAGVVVDRCNRRWVLVSASLVQAACFAVLAVALLRGWADLPLLLVCAALEGAAGAFIEPAQTAALKRIVAASQLAHARSVIEARNQAVALVGPPLAGVLYATGAWIPFAVNAVGQLTRGAATSGLRTALPAPPRTERAGVFADAREGMRFVWSRPLFRGILLMAIITNFTMSAFVLSVTLRLIEAGTSPVQLGLVQAVIAGVSLAGAIAAPLIIARVRLGSLLVLTTVCATVGAIPVAFTVSVPWLLVLLPLVFVLIPSANAALYGYATAVVPDHITGRFMAAMGLSAGLLAPFAPISAGVLLERTGGTVTTLVLAFLLPLAIVPLVATREVRDVGVPRTWTHYGSVPESTGEPAARLRTWPRRPRCSGLRRRPRDTGVPPPEHAGQQRAGDVVPDGEHRPR